MSLFPLLKTTSAVYNSKVISFSVSLFLIGSKNGAMKNKYKKPMAIKHKAGSENSNIPKGSNPLFSVMLLTRMFVEVPISVHVPPKRAAKDIGINNLEGAILASLQTDNANGINIATTAESFINADNEAEIKQKTINATT